MKVQFNVEYTTHSINGYGPICETIMCSTSQFVEELMIYNDD